MGLGKSDALGVAKSQRQAIAGGCAPGLLGAIRELVEAIKAQPSSQNLACGMQHGAISKTLDENTAGIRELVAALRDQIHTEELRYQNLNMKLEMIVEGQRALAARLDRK